MSQASMSCPGGVRPLALSLLLEIVIECINAQEHLPCAAIKRLLCRSTALGVQPGRRHEPPVENSYCGFPLFVVAYAGVFPFIVNTSEAARRIPRSLVHAAESLGASRALIIRSVILPDALPFVFTGARIAGVRSRRAGVLATLINTRGLTGIVILAVGLQLHILDSSLYSLMVVMAIVTTAMAGPLLNLIYPERFVRGDIAEADRAALGTAAGHRILVLIETPAPTVRVNGGRNGGRSGLYGPLPDRVLK